MSLDKTYPYPRIQTMSKLSGLYKISVEDLRWAMDNLKP